MIAANQQHRILWLPGEERMWDEDSPSRSSAGVRINAENAHSVAAVFACLRIRAETVASLPLHVYERTAKGGKRIARELPLYRQLHIQPNGWQTSFEWREQAVMHLDLWGDAFSELKAGKIEPLHPSRMVKIDRLENSRLLYKYREEKGNERPINQDLILHLRGPSDDGVRGTKIVEECKAAIALARACELHGERFFAAGARPGFVLSTDGQLNAEAREMLRSQWNRRHGGVGNSHETAVLTGGLKPYDIPQSSNSDAQFLELRQYQLREIARLFRCPGYLLGLEPGTPQAEIEFVTHTIIPLLRRIETAMMRDLLGDDDRYLIEFDVRGLLRGDASSRAAYNRAMWDIGVVSTNDIRASENLDPVEGGDERYRPLNMGTLGAEPSQQDVMAQQQPGSEIDGQAVEGGLAAAAGDAPAEPSQPEEPQVADVSLNGAQINGLIAILTQVPAGLITKDGAAALIAASFPSINAAQITAILAGVNTSLPTPDAGGSPKAPPQPAPAPARSLAESRAMTISIDFDRTFAADPSLWGEFARQAKADGNTVVMVSRREDTPKDRETVDETLGDYADAFSQVLLVGGGTLKDDAAKAAGLEVDVWVDDSPQTVKRSESRECGANAEGGGGFQPGNKCAKGGGGGGGGGGGSSGGGNGDDTVATGGGGAGAPAHVEGSKAYKDREKHREARKSSDYPEVRASEEHTAIRHTVAEPKYDANGQYIPPSRPEEWTPERQAMHREIIADATAGVPRSEEPTLYMMGGGPAAGKSSLIKNGNVKHPESHVLSNPDELKLDIPEYRDSLASGDSRAARVAHEESSYLNKQLMQAAAKNGQDVVWDGTGDNSIEKLEGQVRALKDKGYKVQADYVTCDTETAVARSNARGEKTGRFVPEEAVRETHARVSEIWPEAVARGLFDRSDLYDTTSGGEPVLVASARGTKLEVKDPAAYQRFLDKAKRRKRSR